MSRKHLTELERKAILSSPFDFNAYRDRKGNPRYSVPYFLKLTRMAASMNVDIETAEKIYKDNETAKRYGIAKIQTMRIRRRRKKKTACFVVKATSPTTADVYKLEV